MTQLRRIKELLHPKTSHSWLWIVHSVQGSVLNREDFQIALHKRLGATLIESSTRLCRVCNKFLDAELTHCEVCALAARTRGHYAVVRVLADGFRLIDPNLQVEAPGITNSARRPADILTTAAVPGRSAALDVCVASPDAAAAGEKLVLGAISGGVVRRGTVPRSCRLASRVGINKLGCGAHIT